MLRDIEGCQIRIFVLKKWAFSVQTTKGPLTSSDFFSIAMALKRRTKSSACRSLSGWRLLEKVSKRAKKAPMYVVDLKAFDERYIIYHEGMV